MAPARFRTLALPLAVFGIALVLVSLFADAAVLLQVLMALAICVAPSFVLLFQREHGQTANEQLLVLVRSLIWRMGTALAVSLALGLAFPDRIGAAFWIALLAGYMIMLSAETWAVLRAQAVEKRGNHGTAQT